MFSSIQFLSCVQLFVTPWTAAHEASLSITNSQSLLKLMSIASVMPSNHLILCHSLSPLVQSFPESGSSPKSQTQLNDWAELNWHDISTGMSHNHLKLNMSKPKILMSPSQICSFTCVYRLSKQYSHSPSCSGQRSQSYWVLFFSHIHIQQILDWHSLGM